MARLLSTGHGGQVLLTLATAELVRDNLPEGVTLDDLGEHRLKDLTRSEHIFQLLAPDLQRKFPPLRTLDNRPGSLPRQATTFIGREKEVASVAAILRRSDVELVTLTGLAGTGKTRLALQVAAELIDEYADGCWFVDLAPVTDPELVTTAIATTLGVRETSGTSIFDALLTHLRGRHLLLVLDNFEQVLDATRQVSQLLETAPRLKIIATSREALDLYGEHIYPVPPLPLPEMIEDPAALARYEVIQLFLDRAQARDPEFTLTEANAPVVVGICRTLDGLPLALELAAARIGQLDIEEIRAELGDRLGLLVGGPRNRATRHQSLRAAIAWSYDLLAPAQQQLFRRLGVFVGGFTPALVVDVCDTELKSERAAQAELLGLVQKSLAGRHSADTAPGGERRFRLLETIREFARAELAEHGEMETLRARHAAVFCTLAEQAEPELIGPRQQIWLNRLEVEHDNLRTALGWALETGDARLAWSLAGSIWRFWFARGHWSEGRELLVSVLALPSEARTHEEQLARGKALNGLGGLAAAQGNHALAEQVYQQSLEIWRSMGDQIRVALALNNLGNVAWYRQDYAAARALYEESLSIKRDLGDERGMALTLSNLGNLATAQLDNEAALEYYTEALALARSVGDKGRVTILLSSLASAYNHRHDYSKARPLLEEALALGRELNDKYSRAVALGNLAILEADEGNYAEARALRAEAMKLFSDLGNQQGIVRCIEHLAQVAGAADAMPESALRAAQIWGSAEALREALGIPLTPVERAEDEQAMAAIRPRLEPSVWAAAWQSGRVLKMEQAIQLALSS